MFDIIKHYFLLLQGRFLSCFSRFLETLFGDLVLFLINSKTKVSSLRAMNIILNRNCSLPIIFFINSFIIKIFFQQKKSKDAIHVKIFHKLRNFWSTNLIPNISIHFYSTLFIAKGYFDAEQASSGWSS